MCEAGWDLALLSLTNLIGEQPIFLAVFCAVAWQMGASVPAI